MFVRWIIFAFTFIFTFASVRAVNCWVCNDAPNNDVCQKRGDLVSCDQGQICQNEIRVVNEFVRITKRCKQEAACRNNLMQNKMGSQCNSGKKKYVCRCCCDTDECNANALFCVEGFAESPDETPKPEGTKRLFTEEEATTLRETWWILESTGQLELGVQILHRFLNERPDLRLLFSQFTFPEEGEISYDKILEDPELATFANRVVTALATIVDLLEMSEQLIDYITILGADADMRNIFENIGPALLDIIQENLEIEKDSDILRTWAKTYSIVNDTISKV